MNALSTIPSDMAAPKPQHVDIFASGADKHSPAWKLGDLLAPRLQADQEAIRNFVNLIFKRCRGSDGTPLAGRLALRAFRNERGDAHYPTVNEWAPLGGDLSATVAEFATRAANMQGDKASVFAPPVAVFNPVGKAGAADVMACPVIVVDLDSKPTEGRKVIEAALGPATVAVASGGVWTAPDGTKQAKVHLYWRLTRPAVSREDQDLLRAVRAKAAEVAGGDPTASSLAHPMRWPGSWHTKGEPVPCKILEADDSREVDLFTAARLLQVDEASATPTRDGRKAGQVFATERALTVEQLQDVAAKLPNKDLEWDDWNKTLMAFFDASHDSAEGEAAALAWSEKSDKHDDETFYARLDHIRQHPPERISAKWLVDRIREKQTKAGIVQDIYCLPHPAITDEERAELANLFPMPAPASSATSPAKLRLMSIDDIEREFMEEPRQPLIDGLLDQGTLSVVYGGSNVGKTFVCLDMAWSIAQGRKWAGQAVMKAATLYIAAEGGSGVNGRALALAARYGRPGASDFQLLRSKVNFYRPEDLVADLLAAARGAGLADIGLIVVDTLARSMDGGDESSSRDMSVVVGHLDALRQASGAHVMLVHHSGKDETKGARGSSALRAAVDTEIELRKAEDGAPVGGTIATMKQRDMDGSFTRSFTLQTVRLPNAPDGRHRASCVALVSSQAAPVRQKGLTARQRQLLAAAEDNAAPGEVFTAADMMEWLQGDAAEAMTEDERAKAIDTERKQLERMAKAQLVTKANGGWRLRTNSPPPGSADQFFQDLDKGEIEVKTSASGHSGGTVVTSPERQARK